MIQFLFISLHQTFFSILIHSSFVRIILLEVIQKKRRKSEEDFNFTNQISILVNFLFFLLFFLRFRFRIITHKCYKISVTARSSIIVGCIFIFFTLYNIQLVNIRYFMKARCDSGWKFLPVKNMR